MRISRVIFLGLFMLFSISCKDKNSPNTWSLSNNKVKEKKTQGYIFKVGWPENYQKVKKIEIDTIQEDEFNQLKPQQDFIIKNVEKKDNHLIFPTKNSFIKLPAYDENIPAIKDGNTGSEYFGFNDYFQLYAYNETSVAEGLSFAEFFLLDKDSENIFNIISLGDWCITKPTFSPDHQFFVYFQDPAYENNSLQIAVCKIGKKEDPQSFLKEFVFGTIATDFSVEEVRWKNLRNLYFKTFISETDENGNEIRRIKYYSAKF